MQKDLSGHLTLTQEIHFLKGILNTGSGAFAFVTGLGLYLTEQLMRFQSYQKLKSMTSKLFTETYYIQHCF